jgi:REP element-mobilizing transposase RayT
MTKFKGKYRIESNRCQYWDYSSPGYYFITICINHRKCILGEIKNDAMILSEQGKIVENEILKIPGYHERAILDEWVIMPNHIHLLIELTDDNGNDEQGHIVDKIHEFYLSTTAPTTTPIASPWWHNPNHKPTIDEIKQYRKQRRKMLIPKILGKLQQQTSKQMNILNNTPGRKNWQPNYHDHIVRDDASYGRIKNYIINNPKNWNKDKFNNNGD